MPGYGSAVGDARRARPMPPGMKLVVSIGLLLVAIFFSMRIVDIAYGEAMLAAGRTGIQATVTGKEISKGKGGSSYKIRYSFQIGGRDFVRTVGFGLHPAPTTVGRALYDSLQLGSSFAIVYSSKDPRFSRPADETPSIRTIFLYILAIGLSLLISVRELGSLWKHERDRSQWGA